MPGGAALGGLRGIGPLVPHGGLYLALAVIRLLRLPVGRLLALRRVRRLPLRPGRERGLTVLRPVRIIRRLLVTHGLLPRAAWDGPRFPTPGDALRAGVVHERGETDATP